MSNYSLDIISHHAQFAGKSFLKHHVDQIDTIGVWGDEPFEIRFRNNTWNKVEIKISIDGTDILTGQPANTMITKDMWVVQPYSTISLKAWPETQNGGARFVFTSANNSVALHTHGDMSNRGIIAAAVFTEGHVYKTVYNNYPWDNSDYWFNNSYTKGHYLGGGTLTANNIIRSNSLTSNNSIGAISNDISNVAETSCYSSEDVGSAMKNAAETLVAVGAGEHVEQKISYVQGLVKPLFTETVRVRYLWWDDLVAKLNSIEAASPHASGFPGDKQNIMSLGSTPRLVTHSLVRKAQEIKKPIYTRF